MADFNTFIFFLGLIATGLSCQLSAVCDSQCSILEAIIESNKTSIDQRYRLLYHVAPPTGWMNDPNGFIYYKDKYHLFYQYNPYDSKWGPMHWGHATSPNLVDWKTEITALIPGNEMCFSGSAIVLGKTLVLMYTGHVEYSNGTIDESQYLAFSDNGVNFIKYSGNPVLKFSESGTTKDFRDPKVWKHGDSWYVVVGTRTTENKGRVLLYKSPDLLTWTYLSVLAESNSTYQMGYMWECPDFFELEGKYILMMSPQGMNQTGERYKNLFQTGYILGKFSYDTYQFVPETNFQEIDYGHDFYATQSTENSGSRILIAWFGMWQGEGSNTTLTESTDGWAGAMTIFRNLTLKNDRILMKPVDAMVNLRDGLVFNETLVIDNEITVLNQTGELIIKANWSNIVELQLTGRNGGGNVTLNWDLKNVTVNRNGDDRQVNWSPEDSSSWRIFLDTSSLELFCGDGEVVFSSRVYPLGGWVIKNLSPQNLNVEAYKLKQSVS